MNLASEFGATADFYMQGLSKAIHVAPRTGGNGKSGNHQNPVRTIAAALALTQDKRGDVIHLYEEGNSASDTTNYLSEALDWSKSNTHLIGHHAGGMVAGRARISQTSTATGVSPLITISGSGNRFENLHIFQGVDDATSKYCVKVTGERNYFKNCHIAGIGHNTMDVAGNYDLYISGGENMFENCVIGLDTIARGTAANWNIEFAAGENGAPARTIFKNCIISAYAEANTHEFLKIPSGGIDRYVLFENCIFINPIDAGATNMTEAFDIHASAGGSVILKNPTLLGATDWEGGTPSGNTVIDGAAPTAASSGLAVNVA